MSDEAIGYLRNCYVMGRNGQPVPTLDSYAIIPMEVFREMGGDLHPAILSQATAERIVHLSQATAEAIADALLERYLIAEMGAEWSISDDKEGRDDLVVAILAAAAQR